jgi:streptogramin lyase
MAKTAGALLTEADAADSIPISTRSQGAAFDASGGLWISQSGRSAATLQKVDPRSGTVKQSCEMPPGLEDLSFDSQGRLWAVSEAGAGRHRDWPTYYPLIFAFDPAKLKPC